MSVILLGRVLTMNKWVGIMLIAFGVACVQLAGMAESNPGGDEGTASDDGIGYRTVGMLLILAAACFSSLAGVSFEKFLKGVKISLWARNLQLAVYSLIIGLIVAHASKDGASIREQGFFHGYTPMTWACVTMNAFGGLLVGCVIKYADAILKDVALGLSIVLSTLCSALLFKFQITAGFVIGMILVIYAAVLYGGNVDCMGLLPNHPPAPVESAVELNTSVPWSVLEKGQECSGLLDFEETNEEAPALDAEGQARQQLLSDVTKQIRSFSVDELQSLVNELQTRQHI